MRSPAAPSCTLTALTAVLLVSLWTTARIHYACGGNWTALFCTGGSLRVPPELDAGTYRFQGIAGYDGEFYRYVAHDPFLQKGYWRYVDAPRLRYRRLLVPLAAWMVGFGRRPWIDGAFFAMEMVFLALGVYWCGRLLALRGRSPLWGILFVVLPATLTSFDRMLVDGPLAAFFAGFLLYCEEERWNRVWVVSMLAALTRETGLLLIAALVADRLWRREWRRAGWFASSCVPAAAWWGYLAYRLPHDGAISILAFPAWGLVRRLFVLRSLPDPLAQLLFRVTDVLAVLGLIISVVLAARWLVKHRLGPVTLCVGFFVALALVLGGPQSHDRRVRVRAPDFAAAAVDHDRSGLPGDLGRPGAAADGEPRCQCRVHQPAAQSRQRSAGAIDMIPACWHDASPITAPNCPNLGCTMISFADPRGW